MIVINSKDDKAAFLALLRKLLLDYLMPYTDMKHRGAVIAHLAWLAEKRENYMCGLRLETFPETETTRITFEIGFDKMPAMQEPIR
jgi:hypothetical protein